MADFVSAPVYITETLDKDVPWASFPEMRKERYYRGVLKVVLKRDLPEDANFMSARFVFAVKSTEDGEVKLKARYVIFGNLDC